MQRSQQTFHSDFLELLKSTLHDLRKSERFRCRNHMRSSINLSMAEDFFYKFAGLLRKLFLRQYASETLMLQKEM